MKTNDRTERSIAVARATPARLPPQFVVALLDEVVATPDILRTWALQLNSPQPFPLVVCPRTVESEQARELVAAAIEEAGHDKLLLDRTVLVLDGELTEADVLARATGFYGWEAPPPPFDQLFWHMDAFIHYSRHWVLTQAELDPPGGPPDFVGIGTQRGGTTWWTKALKEHPEIIIPWKEVHLFDQMKDLPIELYGRIFPRVPGKLAGEVTPEYMFFPEIPRLLSQSAPDAKIFVMLRDPISRYCSGIAFNRRRGTPDSERAQRQHFERGLYGRQLEQVFAHFPHEQVLVLQYERCVQAPLDEYRRTLEFLGVEDTSYVPKAIDRFFNTADTNPDELDTVTRSELEQLYRKDAERLLALAPQLDLGLWPTFSSSRDA